MKLNVVQTIEIEGVVQERVAIEIELEVGETFPMGFGKIVACSDCNLFMYEGAKDYLVEVSPNKFESMHTFDGVALEAPTRKYIKKGQCLMLVFQDKKKFTVLRQIVRLV